MFENKDIRGIYATRYIMSWVRSGGTLNKHGSGYDKFRKWLETLELNEEEIDDIMYLAFEGKMEFEESAKSFLNNLEESF